jgi:hypothetical protein
MAIEILQFDADGALPIPTLKEEIYMKAPQGAEVDKN